MICETWAPESEKVTTERGCFISSSASVWFSLAIGWTMKNFMVALERHVDHQLDRMGVLLAREIGHRLVRALHLGHGVDPVPFRRPRLGAAHRRALVGLGRRLRRAGGASRDRAAPSSVRRSGLARISFHTSHLSNGSCVSNDSSTFSARLCTWANMRPPCFARALDDVEGRAPAARAGAPVEQAEGDRPAALDGELAEAFVVDLRLVALRAARLARDLDHAGAHRLHQGLELVPGGEPAGDRLVVGGLVVDRARGREAVRAGRDRFPGENAPSSRDRPRVASSVKARWPIT